MELALIEMERPQARQAFLEYRRAVRERHSREDEQIMRGYRELARGRQLIHLTDTVRAGGVTPLKVQVRWSRQAPRTVPVTVPRLAIVRADARYCWTRGVDENGALELRGKAEVAPHNRRDRVVFPRGSFAEGVPDGNEWLTPRIRALVPLIPPPFRPTHALSNYHILFEAEWQVHAPPAPRDPALLKHIGGELYAVLAVWDLTDLERAVLAGRTLRDR